VNVVRTGGLEIAYERVGEGPPLAFVHGAGEDGRVWQPQLAALADEFTVVAWDEPGAGRSSDVPADFGLTEYANCLAALIEAVELGPAHVAGISWGGTVVLELYRRHPELVATLILADTYAGWKGSLSAVMAEADQRDLLPRIAVPTLLIWGEQDVRSPLSVARQFERAIPDTHLVVIPRAGDVSNLERPEQFNAAVRQFCRTHSPQPI